MPYVIVKAKVADYARWKPIFDANGANRQASGSKGGQVFRSADDPNEVALLFEWDLEQARQCSACSGGEAGEMKQQSEQKLGRSGSMNSTSTSRCVSQFQ